jgi:hypothetical protein
MEIPRTRLPPRADSLCESAVVISSNAICINILHHVCVSGCSPPMMVSKGPKGPKGPKGHKGTKGRNG